jgi:ATP-dependent Clp protease ATP-binding subunit ClpC
MFERFTDRARRVLVLAQEEARLLDHNFIGTEHILLGLIHEGEGVAAKALASIGISLETVREKVIETVGPAGSPAAGSPEFTPRAKKVLEFSLREALQLGHNYIGTEHLLLGLVREGEGVAAQVLVGLGAELSRIRQEVIRLVSGYAPRATTTSPRARTPAAVLTDVRAGGTGRSATAPALADTGARKETASRRRPRLRECPDAADCAVGARRICRYAEGVRQDEGP